MYCYHAIAFSLKNDHLSDNHDAEVQVSVILRVCACDELSFWCLCVITLLQSIYPAVRPRQSSCSLLAYFVQPETTCRQLETFFLGFFVCVSVYVHLCVCM